MSFTLCPVPLSGENLEWATMTQFCFLSSHGFFHPLFPACQCVDSVPALVPNFSSNHATPHHRTLPVLWCPSFQILHNPLSLSAPTITSISPLHDTASANLTPRLLSLLPKTIFFMKCHIPFAFDNKVFSMTINNFSELHLESFSVECLSHWLLYFSHHSPLPKVYSLTCVGLP